MTNPILQKAQNDRSWAVFIMGFGIFAAIGFFMMFSHAKAKHKIAMGWPEVNGEISNSKIVAKPREDRVGKRIVRRTEYVNECSISYEVDGKSYKKKIASSGTSTPELARKTMRRTGASVRVHYDPDNPATAREHSDGGVHPLTAFGIGGFIVMIGAMIYVSKSRKISRILSWEQESLSPEGFDDSEFRDQHQSSPGIELESMKYLTAQKTTAASN